MQDDTIRELAKSASPQVRVVEYTKQGIKSMMEKRNVVAADRTPVHEFKDINGDWDKVAAAMFDLSDIDEAAPVKHVDKPAVDKDGHDGEPTRDGN